MPAASAQQLELPFAYDGPPPPSLPATVVRDGDGKTTVRAVRVSAPLRIDGVLDEPIYSEVTPISEFIQAEPQHGAPATERTHVWISFDEDNVYVSMRAWESQPERMIVNEMRRDSNQVLQNEVFGVALDTFYDRRNSFNFHFNPIGGRRDGQNINEGANYNGDWNPVWDFAVRRVPDGWIGETAIPFKSIRYRAGRAQIWGVQLRRTSRWKNETSYLTSLPVGIDENGLGRVSGGATLVGIEAPPSSRPLDIKPSVTSSLSSDFAGSPRLHNELDSDIGFDAKYALTQGLTADVTYNTDFAQAEADEQQLNLTRFSLFFPEKRDFFLENQGIFAFGGANANNGDSPTLFYSRRIGLDQGFLVPVVGGGRVTGRSGPYTIGVLDMQTDSLDRAGVPSTNFAVARVRRDVFRRSAIGAIATRRSRTAGGGAGETFGVDGAFAFFQNVTAQTYWARTRTPGRPGDDISYRGQVSYDGDRYGAQAERLVIGQNFNPEVGFVRRVGFHKSRALARFSPRPARLTSIRKFNSQASIEYWENPQGLKIQRELIGNFGVEFQNSDQLNLSVTDLFELLPEPFRIATGVTVPAGGYTLRAYRARYTLGAQRMASGQLSVEHGPFYGGERTQFAASSARIKLTTHLAVEPNISINRVSLPFGEFTTNLIGSRVTYTVTPMMFVSTLMQYNSSNNSLSTNARLRWEYLPGSEFFLVYNEGRDTQAEGLPYLQNRSVVFKINKLFRF